MAHMVLDHSVNYFGACLEGQADLVSRLRNPYNPYTTPTFPHY